MSDVPGVIHALTIGSDYIVSSVLVPAEGTALLQLVNDHGGFTWHPSTLFTTVATRIPSNWTAVVDDSGAVHLSPASWLEPGFWERWYDETYNAKSPGPAARTVAAELSIIIDESE